MQPPPPSYFTQIFPVPWVLVGNNTTHISLLLWNAGNLNNQIQNFQSYNNAENYDIIAITETWLQSST